MSVAELWAGARANEYDALRDLFRALACVSMDEEASGLYLRQYRKSHANKVADALIAAAAVLHSANLWTQDDV